MFGKEVVRKLQIVITLKSEGDFRDVAEREPEDPIDEIPIEPSIVGQKAMFQRVWRCLREKVGIIGLYVVCKDLKLEKVQDDIGRKMGLIGDSWNNKSIEDKAQDIFKVLRKKKFVLLLDDIREAIDLNKVGVPLPSSNIASKLKVGEDTINSHPDIPDLAKIVSKECADFPLALITVGRAMACKNTPEEWNDAIEVLKRSASQFPGMDEVYPRLKFSYDRLLSDRIRSCFLYCSLYPEDYKICKKDLIDCWIGEGLDECDRNRARNRGYTIVGDLIRACLLEEEDDDSVKMHDVIRDMALWIACGIEKEKENFLVHAGAGLLESPNVRKWEGMRRISPMENKIWNL
ncbi:Disease resistance protein [Melia azedarach]|uniref:Disease resistance protein n=1 Tax=Melia azedarach TaxID=155640 RepID=A0ACC1Y403_MELAZ|nr:Disease resistance protein [Melia azedarach]